MVFEIVFTTPVIWWVSCIRGGWMEERQGGGWASWKRIFLTIRVQTVDTVFSVGDRDVHNPQDRLTWPLAAVGTPPILISDPNGSTGPVIHQCSFTGLTKRLLWKQTWQIYRCIVDVSGRCMSVSLILGFKLDFISYANWDGFCKSNHALISTVTVTLPLAWKYVESIQLLN